MLRFAFLFLAAGVSIAPAADPLRQVRFEGDLVPLNIRPNFDNGYLAVYESGGLAIYGPNGKLACRISHSTEPDGVHHRIGNAAIDTDGTVAVAIRAERMTQFGGGIAIFTRAGLRKRVIDTGRYLPSALAFGPDHSIWVLGSHWMDRGFRDYKILHRYAQNGELVGEYLPRAGFAADDEPGLGPHGGWQIRVSGKRVGAMLDSRVETHCWIELDLDGRETGRWLTGDGSPHAFTASGAVYAKGVVDLTVLDREAREWRNVVPPADGSLLGNDGDDLVFRNGNVLSWVPAPAPN